MKLQKLKEQIEVMIEMNPKYADYEVVIRSRCDISNMEEPFDCNPMEAFSCDAEKKEYCLWFKKIKI